MLKNFNINFTDKAKKVISEAEKIARELGRNVVGTEHLLYALSKDTSGIAGMLLYNNNVSPEVLLPAMKKMSGPNGVVKDEYTGELFYTIACERVIRRSKETAEHYGQTVVGTDHLIVSLFREIDSIAVRLLIELNIEPTVLFKDIMTALQADEFTVALEKEQQKGFDDVAPMERMAVEHMKNNNNNEEVSMLVKFGVDITQLARIGKTTKVIGREAEMNRIIQILGRKSKNNPCLIGESGVGKTAIIEGLAAKIASGDVSKDMKNKKIISVDLPGMVSGTKFRGEFEERFKKLLNEAKMNPDVILYFDEIHTIVGTGNAEGSLDAANILKPDLSKGNIKVIGSTTIREYRKHIEKDPALVRRFQPVNIEEPTEEETIKILMGIRSLYEGYHNVVISDEALRAAVLLSKRYVNDRFLPDKAIDIIDEAASRIKNKRENENIINEAEPEKELAMLQIEREKLMIAGDFSEASKLLEKERNIKEIIRDRKNKAVSDGQNKKSCVDENDIKNIVSLWTGVPITTIDTDESERLLNIEKTMHKRVVGQEDAIVSVARAVRRGRTGLKDPDRPVGSFIFLGPTGVGKTEVCKALAEALFGDEKALIKFDMSEYMESYSVSKLIGAPPGYVGFSDEPVLSQKIRNKPYSVILFDEIEKAHPDIFNLLLQILDEGRLTDSKGRILDFKNSVIIMTSNVGAKNITEPKTLGFTQPTETEKYELMKNRVNEELKKVFKPEFLNRVDDILVFKQLNIEEIKSITRILINQLQKRAFANGLELEIDDKVIDFIANKGFSTQYGARPIKRLIQKEIEDKVAEMVLNNNGGKIIITVKDESVVAENG